MTERVYVASVHYTRPDGSTGGLTTGGPDLESAIAEGRLGAAFYAEDGYRVTLAIFALCATCRGSGEVLARGRGAWWCRKRRACPECKREGAELSIGPAEGFNATTEV